MNEAVKTAIAGLREEVTESRGKLASIETYLNGVPELVAVAVREALAEANLDAEAAAQAINDVRQQISDSVDSTLSAIKQNDDEDADTGETPSEPEAETPGEATPATEDQTPVETPSDDVQSQG